jgi:DNA polymerase I
MTPETPDSPPSPTDPPEEQHEHGLLLLIDGNNLAYRAFFALPQEIATSTGFPTNALYGFCSMVIKVLSEHRPEAVIVAWDARGKTFRHEEFEEYKAQRKPMPDLLSEQWPYFEELAAAFGFVNLKLPGHEADDVLATLAQQADAEGRETFVMTGDRDALQLVSPHVRVMANTRGITEVRIYDRAGVVERYGIPPELVPDFIGLKGDSSDNIPGVPGVGEKTAAQLLQEFGSLEQVFENLERVKGEKRRALLGEHRETALMSKRLALLDFDAPIEIHAAEVQRQEPDRERLRELFMRFEFASLLDRLPAALPATDRPAADGARRRAAVREIAPEELEAALAWKDEVGLEPVEADPQAGREDRLLLGQIAGQGGETDGAGAETRLLALSRPGAVAGPLRALLARGPRVCHDFKSAHLLHDFVERPEHDTFIAAYLLAPGRRSYALDELVDEAGAPSHRIEQGEGAEPAPAAALDVLGLATAQRQQLESQGMLRLFREVELPLTRVLLRMEQVGIHLDCSLLGEITGKIQDQLEELEQRCFEEAGEEFNLGSPQQLGQILFEKLALPRGRKTKTGYSTDAKVLDSLKDAHPVVELVLSHRELSKLLSTYLLALPAAVDEHGRLHTTFHQTVAATGRLSSSDPNLQNIPVRTELGARIRQCFTAEEGRLLVVADYSQIELRIMAHLSQEPALLEAFERGADIHARTAAEVFDVPEQKVDKRMRDSAKAVNFGIMYGISAFGLAQNLGIDREQAADYIDRYFDRLPRVRAFIDQTIADARAQGWVATLFGRRRPVPEIRSDNFQTRSLGERLAVNSIIQGTAADIIKVAMIRVDDRLAKEHRAARLVLQVHDELIVESPAGEADRVATLVAEEMAGAYEMHPALGVDTGIGPNWLAAK